MWKLKDKNGKFRSRKSFKQDMAKDSDEKWEVARKDGYFSKDAQKMWKWI